MKLLKGVEFSLGTEMHTFTAIGRCPRTGRLGVAVTTSEIGTGGRAPHVKANVGAVGTQAYTDPRLGILALQLLNWATRRVASSPSWKPATRTSSGGSWALWTAGDTPRCAPAPATASGPGTRRATAGSPWATTWWGPRWSTPWPRPWRTPWTRT